MLIAPGLKEFGDEGRPAGLVSGTGAAPRIAVKIFIKQEAVAKVLIVLQLGGSAEGGPAA
jgi:hypothetical protein